MSAWPVEATLSRGLSTHRAASWRAGQHGKEGSCRAAPFCFWPAGHRAN